MFGLLLVVLEVVLAGRLKTRMRKAVSVVPKAGGVVDARESLCRTCINAHVRLGFAGEKRIACNFGGRLTPIEFPVSECSDYACKMLPIRTRTAGFVRNEENDNVAVIRIA